MISQSRYVNIVSGVGAGASVAQRQLIMRLITQNSLLPPGIVMEFRTSDAVGAYFGLSSEEYARALPYFGFISKNITSPSLISFARWVNTAIAPMIIGDSSVKNLALLSAVTAGALAINDGVTTVHVSAISLVGDATLTAVAAALQTAIRASGDAQLLTANVTFNTNTNQFVLVGTTTGAGSLTVTPGGIGDISALIGWGTSGTVYAPGQTADTAAAAVQKSTVISNNCGSIVICTPSTPMVNADIEAVAAWNAAQNNAYMYSLATPLANAAALSALLAGHTGCAMNILSTTLANDFVEQSPCEIMAATNYNNVASTQNFMYYQFPKRNITVSDDTTADTVDALRANYIGVTQSAGQPLAFYQRGVLFGSSTDATDMGAYSNEMWLKSAVAATIMALFLGVSKVPANQTGAGMIMGVLQQVITQAKGNGTISIGKTLTASQQQYITQISADANAWRQVNTIGYWLSITFSSFTTVDGRVEWQANYMLIYSKDDAIRVVKGSDVMI